MNSRTHMLVGAAASVALLRPDGLDTCLVDVAGGLLGGWLCDIDVNSKSAARDSFFGIDILLPLSVIALADQLFSLNVTDRLLERVGATTVTGVCLFALLAVLGSQWKQLCRHRTFMHSLLALLLFSYALGLAFPPIVPSFAIGLSLHIALDLTTKRGVQVLYPLPFRPCLGVFKSDGTADKVICSLAAVALVLLIAYELVGA